MSDGWKQKTFHMFYEKRPNFGSNKCFIQSKLSIDILHKDNYC